MTISRDYSASSSDPLAALYVDIDDDLDVVHLRPEDVEELEALTAAGRHPRTDGRRFLRDPDGPWRD